MKICVEACLVSAGFQLVCKKPIADAEGLFGMFGDLQSYYMQFIYSFSKLGLL